MSLESTKSPKSLIPRVMESVMESLCHAVVMKDVGQPHRRSGLAKTGCKATRGRLVTPKCGPGFRQKALGTTKAHENP